MFEIYNRKGSNDTFDDHHGQITQKDQPSRGHKTFICERKCKAVKIPEIRTATETAAKTCELNLLFRKTCRLMA